ncbi:MAG: hypothetical protein ABL921_20310 [Pirellula sp.]
MQFVLVVFFATTGCVSPTVRRSAIRWNISAALDQDADRGSKALELAGRSPSELKRLMETRPAPCPHELVGTWCGINKGYGAALAGLHQDVKVFRDCGSSVHGFNILVEQVRVEDLNAQGWRPKRNANTCQPKTMGNFVVASSQDCEHQRSKLVLDYSLANNPTLDPSRYLIDELVVIEPDLLLGRARLAIGWVDVPIAYFVLSRHASNHCSRATTCDELSTE